jgi:hypothetical protein
MDVFLAALIGEEEVRIIGVAKDRSGTGRPDTSTFHFGSRSLTRSRWCEALAIPTRRRRMAAPYLEQIAGGRAVDEAELVAAFTERHGRGPEHYDWDR